MPGGHAERARVGADVVQAQRPRVVDEQAEHAAALGRVADDPAALVVDPAGDEPRDPLAVGVQDPQRGVARAGQLARGLEQMLQDLVKVKLAHQLARDGREAIEPAAVGAAGLRVALAGRVLGHRARP